MDRDRVASFHQNSQPHSELEAKLDCKWLVLAQASSSTTSHSGTYDGNLASASGADHEKKRPFVIWWFAEQAGYLLGSGSRHRPRSRSGIHGEVWLRVGTVGKDFRLVHGWVGSPSAPSRRSVDGHETEPHGQKLSREPVMQTMLCSVVSARKQMGTEFGGQDDIAGIQVEGKTCDPGLTTTYL
ncbi:hypothetical protein LX36DRAFT_655780 [Colletotrichum falcatum]|nr:hypothetical protein LX36DRAFT_655780 [Colletotrichum falcatum]